LLYYSSSQGIKPEDLFNKAGVNQSILDNVDNQIPLEDYYQVFDTAIDLTGDSCLGLHMGESGKWEDLSILGYIMANCSTVVEALEKASKYFGIIGSSLGVYLNIEEDYSRLIFEMRHNLSYACIKHCIDNALINFNNIIKNVTRSPVEIREVLIKAEAPEDIGEYKRIFNCPVRFNQPVSALELLSRDLATPLYYPNSKLLSLLEHHARSFLNKIDDNNYLSRKISLLLFEKIQGGNPSIEDVAKDLGISVRVLQNKLRREGVTFSKLATNVRKDLAQSYLTERHYTVEDIAYLLGFSEPSAFRRAFKTWTGMTPKQYRSSSEPSFI